MSGGWYMQSADRMLRMSVVDEWAAGGGHGEYLTEELADLHARLLRLQSDVDSHLRYLHDGDRPQSPAVPSEPH
jgi:hypothetical protein